jgi:hypothetical protein
MQPFGWSSPKTWTWVSVSVVLSTVVLGVVYWASPYSDTDISTVVGPVLFIAMLPVVALRATGVAPFLLSAAAGAASVVAVVMLRVIVDVSNDPTSHNLWPLEIVIAGVLGMLAGLVAAGLGEVVLRIRRA